MANLVTAPTILAMKARGEKVVCLTAYDFITGNLAEEAGADLVLVGDSVGNTALGFPTTIPVTLDHMIHHVSATRRAVRRALLVADMPFGSYGASVEQAVNSATQLARAGASAVKLEGTYCDEIRAIVKMGIPVMGHVGMTPQSVNNFGGFRAQGRGEAGQLVIEAAKAIEAAGAFAIVLELIPSELARAITEALSIPTIGIGAGPECDGEIQVIYDLLGFGSHVFKHTKRYIDGGALCREALKHYVDDVRAGKFPTSENTV
ncbi:MAG: 3-methyl-2-oxobutanoate hydroxymethyltransferase [Fimbriimonadaceae bacterium]